MALAKNRAAKLIANELLPKWQAERRKLDVIDRWARWNHDEPFKPKAANREYKQLAARSQVPWGDLIVTSVAQTLYIAGYRRPDAPKDATGWKWWQANGMDGRQVPIHKAVLTYGLAYGTGLPGRDLTGKPTPQLRGVSPRDMIAVYDDPAVDEWPVYALKVRKVRKGYRLTLLDETNAYVVAVEDLNDRIKTEKMTVLEHGVGVCPVVRYANRFDLEGRAAGEIEPFIPLLGRIDQTVFDRLVVQRFASWIVRTVAGMNLPESAKANGLSVEQAQLLLRVNDILTAEDKDTKFGSLPATPLEGFIKGHDSDLSDLAAVSQTPAFELLGQMANLSAEALAAAKASQTAKSQERQKVFGESHEQLIRLACHIAGNKSGAQDFMAQVRWEDTSIRSLAQAVDALGKMSTMLGFPPDLLWGKVPGISQQDVAEARDLVKERGGMAQQLALMAAGQLAVGDPDAS